MSWNLLFYHSCYHVATFLWNGPTGHGEYETLQIVSLSLGNWMCTHKNSCSNIHGCKRMHWQQWLHNTFDTGKSIDTILLQGNNYFFFSGSSFIKTCRNRLKQLPSMYFYAIFWYPTVLSDSFRLGWESLFTPVYFFYPGLLFKIIILHIRIRSASQWNAKFTFRFGMLILPHETGGMFLPILDITQQDCWSS